MNGTALALEALFTRYINLFKIEKNSLPSVEFDPPWPSPCSLNINKNIEQDSIQLWRPVERKNYQIFDDLEKALEVNFRDDLKQFYGSFWSNGICVEREDINFSLIQIWNEEDQEQLKENMLGHAFAKLKSRLPLSYFIGCTHGNDVICIEHESGEVVLEKPGRKAHNTLAPSIEEFLLSLNPTLDNYNL
jgi:SecY interacting protein Syd